MVLQVSEAAISEDFDALFATQWEAWTHPRHAMWDLIYPVLETGSDAEAHPLQAALDRQREEALKDSSIRWLKVVDTEADAIVGGALWRMYNTNPFRAPLPSVEATWWPEGSELRMLTNSLFKQFRVHRPKKMQVAHMYLHGLFTHPDHRSRGVGGMCVEWGIHKADEMKIEAYVEAGPMAKSLYEKYGFVQVDTCTLRFEQPNPNPSEEWTYYAKELTALETPIMWRPVGGKYEKGKTVLPWEGKPEDS